MTEPVEVNLEFTPNPNSLKFSVNRALLESGAANFDSPSSAELSPLAQTVFGVGGIDEVMVGTNFITITKAPEGDWDNIAEEVPRTMKEFLTSDKQPAVKKEWHEKQKSAQQNTSDQPMGDVEKRVRDILDKEIRPAVAMDGGDITFDKFEDGKVYLHLQGACSSCPSSVMTLKMGVENRLKEAIPEIKEVVQA